uniref:Uncharacterized protein n=1 Tax=Knipowitschia caucasica TaxID=637954 RepID=A0AAV2MQQ2_KNICA
MSILLVWIGMGERGRGGLGYEYIWGEEGWGDWYMIVGRGGVGGGLLDGMGYGWCCNGFVRKWGGYVNKVLCFSGVEERSGVDGGVCEEGEGGGLG